MKKIIYGLFFISCITFSTISLDKSYDELKSIKKELIVKYKKELGINFEDFSKNSANEIRIFNETLYLKFLSKYVNDISDIKIYSTNDIINIMIFSNIKIDRENFEEIYKILKKDIGNKKLKLIQVPTNNNSKDNKIIQEKATI